MQHSSLHTLKQSRFYPWLTCPPSRIWCNDQHPTPETSVGLRLQKQSLTTPSRGCRVHHAARAMRHWELAATQWTEFERNTQSSTSPGESSARLPAGPAVPSAPLVASPKHLEFSIGDCGDQRTAICCRSSCEWLLHVYFIFGLSMVPIVVKETAVTMALTFEKKHAV